MATSRKLEPCLTAAEAATAAGKLAGNLLVEKISELIDAKIAGAIIHNEDSRLRITKAQDAAAEITNTIIAGLI